MLLQYICNPKSQLSICDIIRIAIFGWLLRPEDRHSVSSLP